MCVVDLKEKIVEAKARLAELETLYYGKAITEDDPESERVQRDVMQVGQTMSLDQLTAIRDRFVAATGGRKRVAIVSPSLDPAEWFKQNLSFGQGDIYTVIALDHPLHRGPDDCPAHAVTVAITGNGPKSKANAEFFAHAAGDLADLYNEVELLRWRAEFFRNAYEDAKNNKMYINMAADQATRADAAEAKNARLESQAREQAVLLTPVLEAFREYSHADAFLDAVSEPGSGASEDEVSDVWHVVETGHEKLLDALGKLDEATKPEREAFQHPDSFDWIPLLDVPPGAIFETGAGVRAVKAKYDRSNLLEHVLCIVLGTGETAVFPDGNLEMVREVAT